MLIISHPKSDFFLYEVTWCGRIIGVNGVSFSPKSISGLKDSDSPRNDGENFQYVNGIIWVSTSTPLLGKHPETLRALLELPYQKTGGTLNNKSIPKIPLESFGWSIKEVKALNDLQ